MYSLIVLVIILLIFLSRKTPPAQNLTVKIIIDNPQAPPVSIKEKAMQIYMLMSKTLSACRNISSSNKYSNLGVGSAIPILNSLIQQYVSKVMNGGSYSSISSIVNNFSAQIADFSSYLTDGDANSKIIQSYAIAIANI